MTTKNKILVLSDIHIGNNSPTNWYQAEVHEPFLQAALTYAIANQDSIQELIILGDLIDFWTYLPTTQPPDFAAIMQQNPNIFGNPNNGTVGQLGLVVDALEGNVTYVHGVSTECGNSDETLPRSPFQAFCPVLSQSPHRC